MFVKMTINFNSYFYRLQSDSHTSKKLSFWCVLLLKYSTQTLILDVRCYNINTGQTGVSLDVSEMENK